MNKSMKSESVDSRDVVCDGGGGALGHPKVYLEIKKGSTSIDCPYCGKVFNLKKVDSAKKK